MPPTTDKTKENTPRSGGDSLGGEEVVISGISGLFPSSDNVDAFMENLFNNVDMVTAHNSNFNHPEMPQHKGQISGVNKFDAQFFRVTYNQAISLEPQCRKLLEQSYCAMYDAGINPLQYKGKKIGVFVGTLYPDSSCVSMYYTLKNNHFLTSGCCRAMLANRISYYLDGKGPSYALDCGWSSSLACLSGAYDSIKSGQCDAAIVGGCNISINHCLTLNLKRWGILCLDGKTKCFDKNGDGFVRSEAINVLFLQKAKDAKRIYAEIYDCHIKYGLKSDEELLPMRKVDHMVEFLEDFYSKAGVSPCDVEYVEANATAIAKADADELTAIGQVFGKQSAVLVGSVNSNMGNSEPASGTCALTKLCLAYQKGKLPANLHYSEPLDIAAIKEGQVEVVTENTPFNRGFTAINKFSYTGMDCHVLLKGHYKAKDLNRYKSDIPRLVLISGRHEEAVSKILDQLNNHPVDPEVLGLLNNIYQIETPGHTCRGYTILDTSESNETVCLSQSVEYYPGGTRPLWLVYSGMGSQWAGMGAQLMRIPIFARAVQRCHKVLEPKGVDLIRILSEPDKRILDNVLNSFIGITATQIALTDVLKEMGVDADYIIGHSLGELGCAYYDGTLTVEEIMLATYTRGVVSIENDLVKGTMAAVGLGYKDIIHLCPPEIDVACHNSAKSSTLSGPADVMETFVSQLKEMGIFAKKVPSGNIAYHSRYIEKVGPDYLHRMRKIIKTPVARSEKWICTSQPEEKWDDTIAQYSSAEYHTNNLLNPVYFEESARRIPSNAVVVEIAPHGLLQAILKRSHSECTHIPLTKRGHVDPVRYLFEAVGKLYQEGYNLKVGVLYPPIQFPVSTETPLLSHFVDWEHSEDWPAAVASTQEKVVAAAREVPICLQDDEFSFLTGHVREGNIVIPEAAMLCLVWETFAMYKGARCKDTSVVFHDVKFHGHQPIQLMDVVKLSVIINKGNGYFEVTQDKTLLSNGSIETIKSSLGPMSEEPCDDDADDIHLNSEDIYKIMNLKGLSYCGEFQSITSFSTKRNTAQVKWNNRWITFLDSLMQVQILSKGTEGVTVPKIIKKLIINTVDHMNEVSMLDDTGFCARIKKYSDIIRCGGVEIKNVVFEDRPIKDAEPDVLASLTFVPHYSTNYIDLKAALQINLQIVADNIQHDVITVAEVTGAIKSDLSDVIRCIAENIPQVNVDVNDKPVDMKEVACTDLLVIRNLFTDKRMHEVFNIMNDKNFILTLEDNTVTKNGFFDTVTCMDVNGQLLALLKKATNKVDDTLYVYIDNDTKYTWLSRVQSELHKNKRIVLVSEKQPRCGLLGFVKKMSIKHGNKIGLVIIDDSQADFDPVKNIYEEQLKKKLILNVFKKGQWGGNYYLPSPKIAQVLTTVKLINTNSGDIDSLKWAEVQPDTCQEALVQVHFAGPTARDVEKAIGVSMINTDGFGMDFSGIDDRGNRVMGVVPSGSLASWLRPLQDLIWPVPQHWTLEEAATVPLPYLLACYALTVRSQLLSGQTVFVTGGAGALGQAVISICLALDCTVYTSVSDLRKKLFLLSLFPKLNENNIGYSHDGIFYNTVVLNTKNKRCDIVVNCASGATREIAMKCVGFAGVFLDLSDQDMQKDGHVGMSFLREARNYFSVRLDSLFREENCRERKILHKVISEGIANGIVRPISHVVYTTADVSRAFRLISMKKHYGRVLIKMGGEHSTKVVLPRMICSIKYSYIVICDDTELGIELANRLIGRGARNLILHLNSIAITGYLKLKLAMWRKLGARVKILTENLKSQNHCLKLLMEANDLGKVHGIFIIKESTKVKESYGEEDFMKYTNGLKAVANNLDFLSRTYCSELSVFAAIARNTCNILDEYTTGVLDNICQIRSDIGLPALLLRVDVPHEKSTFENIQTNLHPQPIDTMLNALEMSIKLKFRSALTYNYKKGKSTEVLRKIARILGVENINDMNKNLTLKDVVSNDADFEELKTVLKDFGKIYQTIEDVKEITIGSLKSLSTTLTTQHQKHQRGLAAFYKFIDPDEILATEVLVPMTTLLDVTNWLETEQELNADETYLMMIPGFEGHHHIFNAVCERIKMKALTFQLGPDLPNTSIQDMALSIYQFMKKRFHMKFKFYLLGYSFGVNVALEIAALLEKDGLTGVIYCLDCSPDALRIQMDTYIGKITHGELQNAIIQQMFAAMTGRHDVLEEELEKVTDWREKVDFALNKMRNLVSYTRQYQKYLIESAYKRIIMAKNYNPNFVLDSQIILLKGTTLDAQDIPNDYNLTKYSNKAVKIFNIRSDMETVLSDCTVPNIVNQMLDPKLLQDYKTKNLCDVYLSAEFKC